ncbi:MAG: hypothetical protein ACE5WD_01640 [Candidatus Aminicenantia bacterium]
MLKVNKETELNVITLNETGVAGRVLGTLANAGINLKALCAYTIKDKGCFLLVTSDNKKAKRALEAAGFKVDINEVITVQVRDRIGAGAEIGVLLGNAIIDIEYCYGSSSGQGEVLLVFKTSDNQKAFEVLS